MIVSGTELSEEETSYLKSRGWYKKNLTVGESLDKISEGDSLIQKKISLTNELIGLMLKDKKYKDKIGESRESIEELGKEVIYRKSIKSFLSNYDKAESVQNII